MIIFSAIAAVITAISAGVAAAGAGIAAAGVATGLGTAGIVSAGLGVAGLGVAAYGQYQQYQAAKDMAAAQRQAESLRKQQTQLQVNNDAINQIRQSQLTRSQNLVRGTSQIGGGAQFGSALPNTTGSVESALGYQLDVTGQAGQLGFGIYNANAQYSDAATQKSIASGISSLGQSVVGNLAPIERVGTYIGTGVQNLTGNTFSGLGDL